MSKVGLATTVSALFVAMAVLFVSGRALAGGWNHNYTDPSNDVSYANVDITRLKSYSQGTDVVIELTVRGEMEDSNEIVYWVYIVNQASGAGVYYSQGTGFIYYYGGGFSMSGVTKSGNMLTGIMAQANAGSEANFDIFGYAAHAPSGQSVQIDWSGAANQGGGTGTDQVTGMAMWVLALLILIPVIIIIVVVVVVLTVIKKKRTAPPLQPQYPPPPPTGVSPQYPQQQYQQPQYPPQQYPPPQQPGQQRPPGQ